MLPVVVVTGSRDAATPSRVLRADRAADAGRARIKEGQLDAPVAVGEDGGTLQVELNHTDPSSLPAGFRLGDNDTRILSVAKNLSNEGHDVTIVSKDLPMRIKASAVGLAAEEYRAELAVDSGWTGMTELDVTVEEMDALYGYEPVPSTARAAELPCHTELVLLSRGGSGGVGAKTSRSGWCGVTATPSACTAAAPSSASRSTCCSTPMSASSASAGAPDRQERSALCAGLEAVMERRQQRKVVVFRPLYAVEAEGSATCRGESEKMGPQAQAVFEHPRRARLPRGRRGGDGPRHARGPNTDPHPRPLAP